MGEEVTPAQQRIVEWRRDPVKMAVEEFKFIPDRWQEKALRVFPSQEPNEMRISLQACAGPGKSAVMALMVWNFLSCYGQPGEHPRGAAVSITWDNLQGCLWTEISKWQDRSEFFRTQFTTQSRKIFSNDHPNTWYFEARSWPKNASPEEQGKTLSGLHSKFVLAIVDESGAIPPTVLRVAEQMLSNCTWGKIVQAGNPVSLEGMLYHAANLQRHLWYVIKITGDPEDIQRSPRINMEWAKEQIELYGRDNPWVKAYILGQFPDASINTLLTHEQVETAMQRELEPADYEWSQKRMGIDVARFGLDRSVLFPRQGQQAFKPVILRNERTTAIAARAAMGISKWSPESLNDAHCFVDDTGHWGHGVIDNLITSGYTAFPVIYHGRAVDPRYKNMRAQDWIEMAKWVKAGGCLPHVPELISELTVPTYTFLNGVFVMEDKDQLKDPTRLGRSPDLADALSNTFAQPDMPANIMGKIRQE